MCKWQRGITGAALTTLTTVCTGGTLNSGLGAAGFLTDRRYQSSSEGDDNSAWSQKFDDGFQGSPVGKSNSHYVRPVRAF
jgi:hypothetical protein